MNHQTKNKLFFVLTLALMLTFFLTHLYFSYFISIENKDLSGDHVVPDRAIGQLQEYNKIQDVFPFVFWKPASLNEREFCLINLNYLEWPYVGPLNLNVLPREAGAMSVEITEPFSQTLYAKPFSYDCVTLDIRNTPLIAYRKININDGYISGIKVETNTHYSVLVFWPGAKNELMIFLLSIFYIPLAWLWIQSMLRFFSVIK